MVPVRNVNSNLEPSSPKLGHFGGKKQIPLCTPSDRELLSWKRLRPPRHDKLGVIWKIAMLQNLPTHAADRSGTGYGAKWPTVPGRALDLVLPPRCTACGLSLECLALPRILLCTACRDLLGPRTWPHCRRCGAHIQADEGSETCPWCQHHTLSFDAAIPLGEYQGELRRHTIHTKRPHAEPLARALGQLWADRRGRMPFPGSRTCWFRCPCTGCGTSCGVSTVRRCWPGPWGPRWASEWPEAFSSDTVTRYAKQACCRGTLQQHGRGFRRPGALRFAGKDGHGGR